MEKIESTKSYSEIISSKKKTNFIKKELPFLKGKKVETIEVFNLNDSDSVTFLALIEKMSTQLCIYEISSINKIEKILSLKINNKINREKSFFEKQLLKETIINEKGEKVEEEEEEEEYTSFSLKHLFIKETNKNFLCLKGEKIYCWEILEENKELKLNLFFEMPAELKFFSFDESYPSIDDYLILFNQNKYYLAISFGFPGNDYYDDEEEGTDISTIPYMALSVIPIEEINEAKEEILKEKNKNKKDLKDALIKLFGEEIALIFKIKELCEIYGIMDYIGRYDFFRELIEYKDVLRNKKYLITLEPNSGIIFSELFPEDSDKLFTTKIFIKNEKDKKKNEENEDFIKINEGKHCFLHKNKYLYIYTKPDRNNKNEQNNNFLLSVNDLENRQIIQKTKIGVLNQILPWNDKYFLLQNDDEKMKLFNSIDAIVESKFSFDENNKNIWRINKFLINKNEELLYTINKDDELTFYFNQI